MFPFINIKFYVMSFQLERNQLDRQNIQLDQLDKYVIYIFYFIVINEMHI